MRTLVIQSAHPYPVATSFRECLCTQRAFIKLGLACDVWGLNHPNYGSRPDLDLYDLIINFENYDTGWLPDLSKARARKLMVIIDAHCMSMDRFNRIFEQGGYELKLQATRDLLDDDSIWFPNCQDEAITYRMSIPRIYDIGFCGSKAPGWPRIKLLEELVARVGLRTDWLVYGPPMVELLNSYVIAFNANVANDINYRSFETLGCGTPLMTNYNPQYEALGFEDGVNCIFYRDADEAVRKTGEYLADRKRLADIGRAGYELSKRHTYTQRIRDLLVYLRNH